MFHKASIPDPEIDAAILFDFVLGLSRAELVLKADTAINEKDEQRLYSLAGQRLCRMPMAYVIGEQDFYGRTFTVNPAVLIPRPETELLVEKALGFAKEVIDSGSSLTIMDMGTGSGILAVTLAKELAGTRVVALDRSLEALQVAQINSRRHGVDGIVDFVASDWLDGVGPKHKFDLVVSNPPYVAESVRDGLQEELAFEPAAALFSGPDGRRDLEKIIATVAPLLAPGGLLLVEIGYDQKRFVLDYLQGIDCFEDVVVYDDYAGLPRILQARKKIA